MPLHRPTIEAQLQRAELSLSTWGKSLAEKGVAEADYRRSPKFRNLSARCTQIRRRLQSVAAGEAVTAEVAARKAGDSSEATEE